MLLDPGLARSVLGPGGRIGGTLSTAFVLVHLGQRLRRDSLRANEPARLLRSGAEDDEKKAAPPPLSLTTPHFDFEREAMANGHRWVAGVDEVGRGPLAGPVGVAAVILDPDDLPDGLDDSKVPPRAEARVALRNHFRQGA